MAPRTVKPKGGASSPAPSSSDDVNLKVLRNDDPNIERIVASSKHAVLYGFDPASRQWARKNVEGSLFVVKRATAPFDAFVVLNRCGAKNLTVEIGGEAFELERSPPYLMYRVGREVNGIWFHDQDECEHMCGVFERVLSGAADAEAPGLTNGVAADALKQLFAKASIDGAAPPAPSSSSSPPTPPAPPPDLRDRILCSSGRQYVSVLPLPVRARTSRSRPDVTARGRDRDWTRVGRT